MRLIPTILCGGAGSRLWPVSRELHPKPFIRMADGQSLLQKAFLRASALPQVQEILTVTNRELFFKTQDEFREVNSAACSTAYVLEPLARNTAAAVAAAALQVEHHHGERAVMMVLAADHMIENASAFTKVVAEASALAEQGEMVVFGIRPERPETGYGYIEATGRQVMRFVEKPELARAREFLASGRFLWNAGMFCFSAGTLLRQMQRYCPEILSGVRRAVAAGRVASGEHFRQLELDAESWAAVQNVSLDYALMEPASQQGYKEQPAAANLLVLGLDVGWRDIGSWSAIADLDKPDLENNRIEGKAILQDCQDCYVRSPERLVAGLGLAQLMIIDTADALLVADRRKAQEVRILYDKLKTLGDQAYRTHRTVHRPWGAYTVLQEGVGFKVKRIEVRPGASLSLQLHRHRSEHWVVVKGEVRVTHGDRQQTIRANESTYIPAGHAHRLENPGAEDAVVVEVQSGHHLAEDDIVRLDDAYGRK